jgi:hypothetical protein
MPKIENITFQKFNKLNIIVELVVLHTTKDKLKNHVNS